MREIRLERLSDLAAYRLLLCLECRKCHRKALYDPNDIMRFLRRDQPLEELKVAPCSSCGATRPIVQAHKMLTEAELMKGDIRIKPMPLWVERR